LPEVLHIVASVDMNVLEERLLINFRVQIGLPSMEGPVLILEVEETKWPNP
jgi:hypothetical protein